MAMPCSTSGGSNPPRLCKTDQVIHANAAVNLTASRNSFCYSNIILESVLGSVQAVSHDVEDHAYIFAKRLPLDRYEVMVPVILHLATIAGLANDHSFASHSLSTHNPAS